MQFSNEPMDELSRESFQSLHYHMPGERRIILHGGYSLIWLYIRYMWAQKRFVFQPFRSQVGYRFWPLWSQTGCCVLHSNLELDDMFLSEEAAFSSLLIRPSRNVFPNAFNIGLNQGSIYTAGLKQGFGLRVSYQRIHF